MPPARTASKPRSPAPGSRHARYVVCLSNDGLEVSLTVGKIYRVRPDARAEAHGLLRLVDETDEDYLFPAAQFEAITVSPRIARAVNAAS